MYKEEYGINLLAKLESLDFEKAVIDMTMNILKWRSARKYKNDAVLLDKWCSIVK